VAVRGSGAVDGEHLVKSSQGSFFRNPLKYSPSLPPICLIVSSVHDWHWSWAEGNDINAAHKADTARLRRIASLPCQLLEAKAQLLSQMEDVGGIAVPAARGKSAASVADGEGAGKGVQGARKGQCHIA